MKPKYKPVNDCKTVAELLADPKRWTKGANARDKRGVEVNTHSPNAVCWCSSGATKRIYSDNLAFVRFRLRTAIGNLSASSILEFNDNPKTTHKQVMAVVKKAGI